LCNTILKLWISKEQKC